jgi:hypothetical protein
MPYKDKEKKNARRRVLYKANPEKHLAEVAAYNDANRGKLKAKRKARYQANREQILAAAKAYREKNPDKRIAWTKDYNDKHREKLRANDKVYREANREKRATLNKAWREANREKVAASRKAYYKANREKILANEKAYRAAKLLGRGPTDVRKIRVRGPRVAAAFDRWRSAAVELGQALRMLYRHCPAAELAEVPATIAAGLETAFNRTEPRSREVAARPGPCSSSPTPPPR